MFRAQRFRVRGYKAGSGFRGFGVGFEYVGEEARLLPGAAVAAAARAEQWEDRGDLIERLTRDTRKVFGFRESALNGASPKRPEAPNDRLLGLFPLDLALRVVFGLSSGPRWFHTFLSSSVLGRFLVLVCCQVQIHPKP